MKNYLKKIRLKKIRYIFEYLIFYLLIRILRFIGFKNSANLCAFLGRKIGPLLPVSKVARKNLAKVFGDGADKHKTIGQIWDNFGRYIGEFPFIGILSHKEMEASFVMNGLEHVTTYQKTKRPFLLFLAHQANWDFVISHITDIYYKFAIIYRKANNPYVDKEILKTRTSQDANLMMIPKGISGSRDLVRAIKGGYSIAMLVDQKMNDGIEVPFFGHPAMTADAIARLALQYNYPIIPCQLVRDVDSKTSYGKSSFKAILHPELTYESTSDKEKDVYNIMLLINQTLEGWIRENPSQWFWFHNRWKK